LTNAIAHAVRARVFQVGGNSTMKEFMNLKLRSSSSTDPVVAEEWIMSLQKIFDVRGAR